MATTLTVTDLGNGTGATATVAGSAGGSNVVYYQQVTAQTGAGAWAAGGSRTGDGTVPLALPLGYYFAYCQTGAAGVSNLCYFAVTSGLDAVTTRCFNAVKATIQLLNKPFTQLVIDSQYAGEQPLVKYPCTVLTTEDASQTDESVVNGRDDLGNPVRVQILLSCVEFSNEVKDTLRRYRQDVFRAFHNQRLSGVPESVITRVELGPIAYVASEAPHARSELTVRCVTREVRGLGA